MASKSDAALPYYTEAELDELGSQLTMGDVWRVRSIEDDEERGAALYFHAAVRLGMHTGDMQSFLDRILEGDFSKLLTAKRRGLSDEGSSGGIVSRAERAALMLALRIGPAEVEGLDMQLGLELLRQLRREPS